MRDRIIEEALTWIDTPFKHGAGVKGHGCDCAHLISGVFETLNLILKVNYPVYGPDFFRHSDNPEKFIIEGMKAAGFREVAEGLRGDVAVLKIGKVFAHCVILCGDGSGIEAWVTRAAVSRIRLKEEKLWRRSEKRYFTVIP